VADAQKFAAATGFLFILAAAWAKKRRGVRVVSRFIDEVVKWPARRGLRRDVESFADAKGGSEAAWRFEEVPGELPVVRLHKAAFIHRCKPLSPKEVEICKNLVK
jgi:hypothetical protein